MSQGPRAMAIEDERIAIPPGTVGALVAAPSPRRQVISAFFRKPLAVSGLAVLSLLLIMALFAPVLSPADPAAINLSKYRMPPSSENLLGTDTTGRDVLSRLIFASRVSLSVGLVAVAISVLVGTTLGAISGYYGGLVDSLIMRLTDIALCFPSLIIILVVVALVGPSIVNIMVVIGLLNWAEIARLVRGQILSIRELDYVDAARCVGASNRRIILRHVLPGVIGQLVVAATFGVAAAILLEAGLSFLGLGVQPPTASWGNMLSDAQSLTILERMWWLWVPPGAMILLAVLAINFVGDGLYDALNARR